MLIAQVFFCCFGEGNMDWLCNFLRSFIKFFSDGKESNKCFLSSLIKDNSKKL